MAALVLKLTAETDLIYDALDSLSRIHHALVHRHGAAFRALEKDIEALGEQSLDLGHPHDLGEGVFVFEPPRQFVDLIDRARALGVI